MEINDNIIQKILKLKELSERGATEGEINNATRVLQFNLDKYGITLDVLLKMKEKELLIHFLIQLLKKKLFLPNVWVIYLVLIQIFSKNLIDIKMEL